MFKSKGQSQSGNLEQVDHRMTLQFLRNPLVILGTGVYAILDSRDLATLASQRRSLNEKKKTTQLLFKLS